MIDLECSSCGFKFRKAKMPERCPYCSTEGAVVFLKTAQDLLDETFGKPKIMGEEGKRRI